MAERKAVNKYYPPEWEPKHGSINKFRGQHPLRERAKKLNEGILVVRFEMPYNVWCTSCDQHIGKGVRYNAEKKQVGNYFSTKIWSFRMKCHLCSGWMEVRTDPQTRDYIMVNSLISTSFFRFLVNFFLFFSVFFFRCKFDGVSRKTETWEGGEEQGTIGLASAEEKEKLEDPFYRLEHKTEDVKKAEEKKPALLRLMELKERSYDDYGASQYLRRDFREKKKELNELKIEAQGMGLAIDLLPADASDENQAKQVQFQSESRKLSDALSDRKLQIRSGPILAPQTLQQSKAQKQALLKTIEKAKKAKMDLKKLQPHQSVSSLDKLSLKITPTIQKPKPSLSLRVAKQSI